MGLIRGHRIRILSFETGYAVEGLFCRAAHYHSWGVVMVATMVANAEAATHV